MPTTSPASAAPVLRLSSPDDVFAAIPYLLGFHPRHSLVALGLSGPRSRLGVSMRIDVTGSPDQLAGIVVNALQRNGDEEAILVLYDPAGDTPGQPGQPVVAAVRAAFDFAGIRLRDAFRVTDQRWWSYLCTDIRCCPPEGTPVRRADEPGGPSRVAASAVAAGMAALPDRASLRAGLGPPAPWTRAAAEQALDRVGERLAARWEAGERETAKRELLELTSELRERFRGRLPTITTDEAAMLAVALHDVTIRDEVVTWADGEDVGSVTRLLVEVVRLVGPPENVPAATVLAWCSYLQGDGALAAVALELALETDPSYTLAQLLDRLIQGGVPPDELRRTARLTAEELRHRRQQRE